MVNHSILHNLHDTVRSFFILHKEIYWNQVKDASTLHNFLSKIKRLKAPTCFIVKADETSTCHKLKAEAFAIRSPFWVRPLPISTWIPEIHPLSGESVLLSSFSNGKGVLHL